MSIFHCARCDNLKDADDGCDEVPGTFDLICIDCMEDAEAEREEADDRAAMATVRRRLKQGGPVKPERLHSKAYSRISNGWPADHSNQNPRGQ